LATIITRAGKGSPLTNAETDANFVNLNNAKLEVTAAANEYVALAGTYANPPWITTLAETKVLPVQSGNNSKFLQTNGTYTAWASVDLSAYTTTVTADV